MTTNSLNFSSPTSNHLTPTLKPGRVRIAFLSNAADILKFANGARCAPYGTTRFWISPIPLQSGKPGSGLTFDIFKAVRRIKRGGHGLKSSKYIFNHINRADPFNSDGSAHYFTISAAAAFNLASSAWMGFIMSFLEFLAPATKASAVLNFPSGTGFATPSLTFWL